MDCNLRIPTLPWILLRPTACFPLPSRYVNLLQAGRPPSQLHCRRKTFGACRLNKLLVMHINNNLKWEEQGNEWRTSIHGTFAILYAIMKRATNKCNLVCNIAAKRVGKRAFFHPCSSLSWKKSGCYNLRRWILASVWMKLCHTRELCHLLQKKIALGRWKHIMYRFYYKSRPNLYCLQQLYATCSNLICYEAGLLVGGKMCNIAIQVVSQPCYKTGCTFLLPFLPYLK